VQVEKRGLLVQDNYTKGRDKQAGLQKVVKTGERMKKAVNIELSSNNQETACSAYFFGSPSLHAVSTVPYKRPPNH
jgi:hypothetical protein